MSHGLNYIAQSKAAAGEADIFASIGIDWTLLILQTIAFLVLLWFLGKFVYPALSRSLDKREADLERANKMAVESQKKAEEAKSEIEELIEKARRDATDIVATAKNEAAVMVDDAEKKAKNQAESIVESAHNEIEKEVVAAKKMLHNEAIELVAQATEKVVGSKLDAAHDKDYVKSVLKEVR